MNQNRSSNLLEREVVFHERRGKCQAGQYILADQGGIFVEHVFNGVARGEKFKNGLRGDAGALDNRLSVADIGINNKTAHKRRLNGLAWKLKKSEGLFPLRGFTIPEPPAADGQQRTGTLANANDAYKNICPTYIPKESTFYVDGSAWTPKKPDEVTTDGGNLQAGENQYAYVTGLNQYSRPDWPIIADGFAEGETTDGHYSSDPRAKGGVWRGAFAVVVCIDGTGSVEKCTQNWTVFGWTGQTGPANVFVPVNDPKTPWLSGTGVQVLNPFWDPHLRSGHR